MKKADANKKHLEFKIVKDEEKIPVVKQSKRSYVCIRN